MTAAQSAAERESLVKNQNTSIQQSPTFASVDRQVRAVDVKALTAHGALPSGAAEILAFAWPVARLALLYLIEKKADPAWAPLLRLVLGALDQNQGFKAGKDV